MKVLIFTSEKEDYLEDSIIHGFKSIYKNDIILYPEKPMLYDDFNDYTSIRGNGFTLYGNLDARYRNEDIEVKEILNHFDLIIFPSIYKQYKIYYNFFNDIKHIKDKVWIMDGGDTDVIFPYMYMHIKENWNKHRPHRNHLYFKRELTTYSVHRSYYCLIPKFLSKNFKKNKNLQSISFSIPENKLVKDINFIKKQKLFTKHIVDEEVARYLKSNTSYVFNSEIEYYNDLQSSKYGVTTKRAGWDCLRHYEIAANGAVICFKNLHLKPKDCAPFGLIPNVNCLSYTNYEDLIHQIQNISSEQYKELQRKSLDWIKTKTTINVVKEILNRNYNKKNDL